MKAKRKSSAERYDRHILYQEAVQDVVAEIDFVADTFRHYRQRPAVLLREDFCGTANTACEWVRRGPKHRAVGVDLDREVLAWAESNNRAQLSASQRKRLQLLHKDVRKVSRPKADVVLAMNFSYYLFLTREEMCAYFRSVHRSLAVDGLFFLDAYGGYDAPKELSEPRDCGEFTYIWEQATFNPIDAQMQCYIHFEFPDGSRMDRAFSYYWRLWTLPEIREMLLEAGFKATYVYWEGTDEDTNEGNGIFSLTEQGEADPGWICYLIAEP